MPEITFSGRSFENSTMGWWLVVEVVKFVGTFGVAFEPSLSNCKSSKNHL